MMGNCIKESLSTSMLRLRRVKVELKHVRREPDTGYCSEVPFSRVFEQVWTVHNEGSVLPSPCCVRISSGASRIGQCALRPD